MSVSEMNTQLYEKMVAEQDKFREWLHRQTPEEILNHAYEYTIREDIVMAMAELELSEKKVKALLKSECPLEDVYRFFEKTENNHMEDIRDSIENRADYEISKHNIPAKYVSVWDGGSFETFCTVNTETREVFHIQKVEDDREHMKVLKREYIVLSDAEYALYPKEEWDSSKQDTFWRV